MPSTPLADVLADARARLDLPALPIAAPGGLVAWCLDADLDASPLPPLADRIQRRTGPRPWRVGHMPAEPLAADLAARGLTYRHGLGSAVHGEPVEPSQAARLLADVLDDAAAALGALSKTRAALSDQAAEIALVAEYEIEIAESSGESLPTSWLDTARAAGREDLAAAGTSASLRDWLALLDWATPLERALAAALRARGDDLPLDPARDARLAEAGLVPDGPPTTRGDRLDWHADALRATALDLRASRAAQGAALALVRPYLPDGRPVVDEDAVAAFLATFDDAEAIARPDLGRAYVDAGAPGGLDVLPLYALAAERWGAPVKRRGTITFRPAPLTDRRPALRLTR
ncbi:hypothetical protein [Demequina maris]|uniref:hypothetical protein n=1 Tax=Demequina maris TaxID=1638982 RepID=UPI000786068A|nr:hypothetical protein [Demequina maris]